VANDARKIHRQTHAEMQGDGSDPLAIDGRADVTHDADQETPALFDLLLVPALRRTASLHAPDGTPVSKARGRSLRCAFISRTAGADQAKNYRDYALSRWQRRRIHRQQASFRDSFWSAAIFRRFQMRSTTGV